MRITLSTHLILSSHFTLSQNMIVRKDRHVTWKRKRCYSTVFRPWSPFRPGCSNKVIAPYGQLRDTARIHNTVDQVTKLRSIKWSKLHCYLLEEGRNTQGKK